MDHSCDKLSKEHFSFYSSIPLKEMAHVNCVEICIISCESGVNRTACANKFTKSLCESPLSHHHIFLPFPSPFLLPLPLFSVTVFRVASLCCYAFILTYFSGPEIAPGGCSGLSTLFWGLENEVCPTSRWFSFSFSLPRGLDGPLGL